MPEAEEPMRLDMNEIMMWIKLNHPEIVGEAIKAVTESNELILQRVQDPD